MNMGMQCCTIRGWRWLAVLVVIPVISGACASTGSVASGSPTSEYIPPGGPYCGTKIPPPSTTVGLTAKLSVASGQQAGRSVKGFVNLRNNGSHIVRIFYYGGGIDTVATDDDGTRVISTERQRTFVGVSATLGPGKTARYPIFLLSAKCPAPSEGAEPPLGSGTYPMVAIIGGTTTNSLDDLGSGFTVSSAVAEVTLK